ncbi:hypothetical protein CLOM_g8831 [Closterium sp. NIES-68]|nr:hypothetical protein CLOM_g21698 [Closterium sp. NIES-68]GJP42512.1 hypothetical protein CLOM_g2065 [Closterium sp. NIES-68]GJP49648.1 hypothetical protein CLOM_g8831 [Closterium sp. NIES-68]
MLRPRPRPRARLLERHTHPGGTSHPNPPLRTQLSAAGETGRESNAGQTRGARVGVGSGPPFLRDNRSYLGKRDGRRNPCAPGHKWGAVG